MPFRARLALAAISAALVPFLPVPAHASVDAYGTVALWTGSVTFGDSGRAVTVAADTEPGYCEDLAGALLVRLNECRAYLWGSYMKQSAGSTRLCAGVGNGWIDFVDSTGQRHPAIPVVLVAGDGVITYSGRYVDAFGRETYSVEGEIDGACGSSLGWWGMLDLYKG